MPCFLYVVAFPAAVVSYVCSQTSLLSFEYFSAFWCTSCLAHLFSILNDQKRREDMDRLEKERQAEMRSYKNLMVPDKMTSNKDIASGNKSLQELEEDFMWMQIKWI